MYIHVRYNKCELCGTIDVRAFKYSKILLPMKRGMSSLSGGVARRLRRECDVDLSIKTLVSSFRVTVHVYVGIRLTAFHS